MILSLKSNEQTRGVSYCDLAIYNKKNYLKKAIEELWKLKYFTMQKYNLPKNPLKETKILQDIITLYTLISNFKTCQKFISQKSSYKNRSIYLRGQNPLRSRLKNIPSSYKWQFYLYLGTRESSIINCPKKMNE
jgi:hypothetical protein